MDTETSFFFCLWILVVLANVFVAVKMIQEVANERKAEGVRKDERVDIGASEFTKCGVLPLRRTGWFGEEDVS